MCTRCDRNGNINKKFSYIKVNEKCEIKSFRGTQFLQKLISRIFCTFDLVLYKKITFKLAPLFRRHHVYVTSLIDNEKRQILCCTDQHAQHNIHNYYIYIYYIRICTCTRTYIHYTRNQISRDNIVPMHTINYTH